MYMYMNFLVSYNFHIDKVQQNYFSWTSYCYRVDHSAVCEHFGIQICRKNYIHAAFFQQKNSSCYMHAADSCEEFASAKHPFLLRWVLYETLSHLELLEGKLSRRKFEIRLVQMDSGGLKYLRSAPHTKKYEDIYLLSSHLFVKDR